MPGNIRDLFHVAYRLIAVVSDEEEPTDSEEAIQYAFEDLNRRSNNSQKTSEYLKDVASAIANGQSLEELIWLEAKLPTKKLEKEFRNYLATEIRKIAKIRQVSVNELCDVTERTMLNWIK